LAAVLAELVAEIKKLARICGYGIVGPADNGITINFVEKLSQLAVDVKKARLTDEELPILRRIAHVVPG